MLELMLAMIIAVVLASVMYASLRIGFKAREHATQVVDAAASGRIASEVIRMDLAGVQPPTGILAGSFTGSDDQVGSYERDTLNYYTNNTHRFGSHSRGELFQVRLHLADPEETANGTTEFESETQGETVLGRATRDEQALDVLEDSEASATTVEVADLVRDVTSNLLAADAATVKRHVVARRVVGFNVRYYDGADWQDEWDSGEYEDTLPVAIELTLTMLPEDMTLDEAVENEALLTTRRTWPLMMGKTLEQRDEEETR